MWGLNITGEISIEYTAKISRCFQKLEIDSLSLSLVRTDTNSNYFICLFQLHQKQMKMVDQNFNKRIIFTQKKAISDVSTLRFELNFINCVHHVVWYISIDILEERSTSSLNSEKAVYSETSVFLYQVASRYLRKGTYL